MGLSANTSRSSLLRVLLATTNADKLREIRHVIGHLPVELLTLEDFPRIREPEETGATFADNARLKAVYYDAAIAGPSNLFTVAEDSGFVIDALDGAPGVQSARFLRPNASYPERFAEIYRRLAARPTAPRTARFVCAVAVARGGTVVFETAGITEGELAAEPHGSSGFGYDPIFYYPPYGRTFADVSDVEKLRVAHRGIAFRTLTGWLEDIIERGI